MVYPCEVHLDDYFFDYTRVFKDVLTRVKIPRNKGGHCPFRKSQLDSRMFGMVGPTGLWTRYHSK